VIRRTAAAGVVIAAAASGALALTAPAIAPARPAAHPARLLVQATEFRFAVSRTSLAAGPAIVQLVALGEDPHDLRLVRLDARGRRAGGIRTIRETLPGGTGEWRGRLSRGRWRLFCSLPGHERAGMRATVRVR
jgi:hypothetical protein